MGVNNSPKVLKPNLWVGVDKPDRFLTSIWYDPFITKFAPKVYKSGPLWDGDKEIPGGVNKSPNVIYFDRMNGIKIDPELEAKGVGLHRHREYLRRHK